jgi:hypothetical protein
MSEPTLFSGDLEGDLRAYFALTTSTELPRRVREMGVRTLRSARFPGMAMLSGAAGVVVGAALVVVIATHAIPHGAATTGAGSARAPSGYQGAVAAPSMTGTIAYPGVDTSRLASSGARLLLPSGHGSAAVTPAEAEVTAVAAVGADAQTPGPAVLTFAQIAGRPVVSCLCWVVDVPVRGGVALRSPGPALSTELVLVDAVSGHLVTALFGNGIP